MKKKKDSPIDELSRAIVKLNGKRNKLKLKSPEVRETLLRLLAVQAAWLETPDVRTTSPLSSLSFFLFDLMIKKVSK